MKNILIVTKYTFIEVYRSKVMVSLLFMALGLLLITYVASEFAYGAPAKVSLDVGLGLLAISNLVMAIFIGAGLLNKEIEQKTLYMILSRPISRASFLVGKTFGLSVVLFINSFLLTLVILGIFSVLGGHYQSLIVWSAFFSFLESVIILLFAVYFSLITNTTMSVINTIVVYIVGHVLNETLTIIFTKTNMFFSGILKFTSILIPHFYQLNLRDYVLYRQNIETFDLLKITIYAFGYIAFMYFIISYIFNRKNLD